MRHREFIEMDIFEKAVVIGFLNHYAESKKKERNASKKGYRKRKRK